VSDYETYVTEEDQARPLSAGSDVAVPFLLALVTTGLLTVEYEFGRLWVTGGPDWPALVWGVLVVLWFVFGAKSWNTRTKKRFGQTAPAPALPVAPTPDVPRVACVSMEDFVRAGAAVEGGFAEARWVPALGIERYDEYRDYLIGHGVATWNSKRGRNQGWRVPPDKVDGAIAAAQQYDKMTARRFGESYEFVAEAIEWLERGG
jgi:hypothetical protein